MKRRLRRERTLELQTVFQKADALAWYRLFENDARLADRWPMEHANVTAEDVRALATRLLVDDASTTVVSTPR
jgi:predicted Zn-dependent peptidase